MIREMTRDFVQAFREAYQARRSGLSVADYRALREAERQVLARVSAPPVRLDGLLVAFREARALQRRTADGETVH